MLTPVWSGRFKRDVKRTEKRGKDMAKLRAVLTLRIEEKPLPARFRDHALQATGTGLGICTSSRTGSCSTGLMAANCSLPAPGRMLTCSIRNVSYQRRGETKG